MYGAEWSDTLRLQKGAMPGGAGKKEEGNLESLVLLKMEEIMFGETKVRGMSGKEQRKLALQRGRLRQAVRECVMGSIGDRIFVKEYIKEILVEVLHAGEKELNTVIPFDREYQQTAQDKFEILQNYFAAEGRELWFHKLYQRLQERASVQEPLLVISREQLEGLYWEVRPRPDFFARLEIVSQRIYQNLYGFSVCDLLISEETMLEGVSAGCGGQKERGQCRQSAGCYGYDTIFVMLDGRKIRLSFLSFGSEQMLQAVVKRISRNSSREQLSRKNSSIVTNLKSNARVVAVRPPVSDGWVFYVRKFRSVVPGRMEELLTGEGSEAVISLLRLMVCGGLNLVITGEQASGKTTLLKGLVGFIPKEYSIRIAENVFECRLNEIYPDRNIHCMQEYGGAALKDLITFFKKTDTDVTICGEINEPETAVAMIQIAQSGGRFTLSTSHHGTTEKLLQYMRNALLIHGGFHNEQMALEQVVAAVHVDVHLAVDAGGKRFVERITEIVPDVSEGVCLRELLAYENGAYRVKQPISREHAKRVMRNYPQWRKEKASKAVSGEE